MKQETIKYHTAALEYLESYYKALRVWKLLFRQTLHGIVVMKAKIVRESRLGVQDQENALVALCFWISGMCNLPLPMIPGKTTERFWQAGWLPGRGINESGNLHKPCIEFGRAQTDMEKAMSDATNYRFATDDMDDLIIHGSYLKEEFNRRSAKHFTELDTLSVLKQHFVKCNFHTDYAQQKLSPCGEILWHPE